MTVPQIAVLCPTPEYEENWSHVRADYIRLLGAQTVFIDWTKADHLAGFDLVTPLLAWGYTRDCGRWFALLDRMESDGIRVANPVNILRWNSDKSYLNGLAAAGVATVPTIMCEALDGPALAKARAEFGTDTLVIKPPISGGADGTFRLAPTDAPPAEVAGKRMMVQPYLASIAVEGEYSLFYFGGKFSHSIIKRPANGDFRVQEQFGGREQEIEPPTAAVILAEESLKSTKAITGSGTLAYARVDMLRNSDGQFQLMELELIEPSLFLHFAPDKGALFAQKLLRCLP